MTPISRIVVVGHGTAAFVSALALSRALEGAGGYQIAVVETPSWGEDSACLAPAEASLPPLRAFLALLGLTEGQVAGFAEAAPYLGSLMAGWPTQAKGASADFVLAQGETGAALNTVAFHHYLTWLRQRRREAGFEAYNLAAQAARAGRFQTPTQDSRSILSTYTYGLNLNAAAFAEGVKAMALARGVRIIAAAGFAAELTDQGHIAALALSDGGRIAGDLFIDATGTEARLMRAALGAPLGPVAGLTAAGLVSVRVERPTARPLNRCDELPGGYLITLGLGAAQVLSLVYDPDQLDETAAVATLEAVPGAHSLSRRRFQQGRLAQAWRGNCIAVGAAAGVLEPLGVSGLHGLQADLTRLIGLFPDRSFHASLIGEYNRLTAEAFDRQRDFVLAAYGLSGRLEAALWPAELARKIEQFKSRGRVVMLDAETFNESQWINLFLGLGLAPERYDPMIDGLDATQIEGRLRAIKARIAETVAAMPPFRAAVPSSPAAVRA